MITSTGSAAFLIELREELAAAEAAAATYEPTTPDAEYHDGQADGLRWVWERLAGIGVG